MWHCRLFRRYPLSPLVRRVVMTVSCTQLLIATYWRYIEIFVDAILHIAMLRAPTTASGLGRWCANFENAKPAIALHYSLSASQRGSRPDEGISARGRSDVSALHSRRHHHVAEGAGKPAAPLRGLFLPGRNHRDRRP